MATTAALHTRSSRASPASVLENASVTDITLTSAPPPPPANPGGKKAKGKKGAPDQTDAARQLQAKIAQLEQDAAGRSEEDAEIGRTDPTTRANPTSVLTRPAPPQNVKSKRPIATCPSSCQTWSPCPAKSTPSNANNRNC